MLWFVIYDNEANTDSNGVTKYKYNPMQDIFIGIDLMEVGLEVLMGVGFLIHFYTQSSGWGQKVKKSNTTEMKISPE